MSYHQTGSEESGVAVCQYPGSRLWFRGPKLSLDTPYAACVGGNETYGRFVDRPFASILEHRLNRRFLNLGSLSCGLDALCGESGLQDLLNCAEFCIVQLPDILGQSNRFYRVHPRRNDRFLAPTQELTSLYPEVDFADVHFVHHLIRALQSHRDARFEVVAEDLRRNWVSKLSMFLQRLKPPVLLLHLQVLTHSTDEVTVRETELPVTLEMTRELHPYCAGIVDISAHVSGQSEDLEDLLFGTLQQPMAEHMIGPVAHRAIAEALLGPIRDLN